jgi:hypothetical protein
MRPRQPCSILLNIEASRLTPFGSTVVFRCVLNLRGVLASGGCESIPLRQVDSKSRSRGMTNTRE